MRKHVQHTRMVLLLATVGAVIIGTGVATGAIPGGDGTITGCYKAKGGALRVIDSDSGANCASDEVKLTWSQKGPVGPAGAKGDPGPQGDTGPQGPQGPAAGESPHLLGSDADLPNGDTLVVSIDGFEVFRPTAYRINCTTSPSAPGPCELVFAGAPGQFAPAEVASWYQTAANDPTAARSFSVLISDSSGTTIRKYFVSKALPTALLNAGGRYQITLQAPSVQQLVS